MKINLESVNSAAVALPAAADIAAAANPTAPAVVPALYRFDVIKGTFRRIEFDIQAVKGFGPAARAHFASAWYNAEKAAAAVAVAAVAAAAAPVLTAPAVDGADADAARAAVDAVTARRAVIDDVAAAVAAVVAVPAAVVNSAAAAVRGRMELSDVVKAAAADVVAVIAADIAADTETINLRPVMDKCGYLYRLIWGEKGTAPADVLTAAAPHCSAAVARYIVAAVRPALRIEKGRYVSPSTIRPESVAVAAVKAILWYKAGRALPQKEVEAREKAARNADVAAAANNAKNRKKAAAQAPAPAPEKA